MSELLKEAAKEVAKAWNDEGPVPADHRDAKHALFVRWPELYRTVSRLAYMVDDGWEYTIEETNVVTGDKGICSAWTDNPEDLEEGLKHLRTYEQNLADYGGGTVRKTYKIVKAKKRVIVDA